MLTTALGQYALTFYAVFLKEIELHFFQFETPYHLPLSL